MFLKLIAGERLSLRQSDYYGKQGKRHGEGNTASPINAADKGMFLLNTDGAGRAHGGAVL